MILGFVNGAILRILPWKLVPLIASQSKARNSQTFPCNKLDAGAHLSSLGYPENLSKPLKMLEDQAYACPGMPTAHFFVKKKNSSSTL